MGGRRDGREEKGKGDGWDEASRENNNKQANTQVHRIWIKRQLGQPLAFSMTLSMRGYFSLSLTMSTICRMSWLALSPVSPMMTWGCGREGEEKGRVRGEREGGGRKRKRMHLHQLKRQEST
jgi:hypothetical protein